MTDREGAFKLCIFGDGGVGKTTLVNRYLTKVFDTDIKMTVGADFYVRDLEIDGKKVVIRIWDFGGEQRFKVLLPSFAKGADGGIFMFDITRYTSVKNIDDWLVPALQMENETVYFSNYNHGIVQRIKLEPEKELAEISMEAIANEVIIGLLGISIRRK